MPQLASSRGFRLAWRAALVFAICRPLAASDLTVEKTDRGVTVKIDGQVFTEYLIRSGAKPILWPVNGPGGKALTRAFPMQTVAGESNDHVHQRSLWFTHGSVNGISFWDESPLAGTIEHREFLEVHGGPTARIATRNDWLGPDKKKVCEDRRVFSFRADDERRTIDFEITLTASAGPVRFGDTKEGTFGVRMADSMTVDAKRGGQIINSAGQTDLAAWGQPADWVDYHGPVDGETLGLAILNHPSSFRYPTRWHVRPYGLFAANPFGLKAFEAKEEPEGRFKLAEGKSLTLRYRLILHRGDEKKGKIADQFAAYAKEQFAVDDKTPPNPSPSPIGQPNADRK